MLLVLLDNSAVNIVLEMLEKGEGVLEESTGVLEEGEEVLEESIGVLDIQLSEIILLLFYSDIHPGY